MYNGMSGRYNYTKLNWSATGVRLACRRQGEHEVAATARTERVESVAVLAGVECGRRAARVRRRAQRAPRLARPIVARLSPASAPVSAVSSVYCRSSTSRRGLLHRRRCRRLRRRRRAEAHAPPDAHARRCAPLQLQFLAYTPLALGNPPIDFSIHSST